MEVRSLKPLRLSPFVTAENLSEVPGLSVNPPPDTSSPARLSTLLKLAGPVIVSRSTQVVVGLADALMVTHLGTAALAAATTGAMNTFVAPPAQSMVHCKPVP